MYFFMSSSSFPCGFVKKAFRGNPDSPDDHHDHHHDDDCDDDHLNGDDYDEEVIIPGIEWAPRAIENISWGEMIRFCSSLRFFEDTVFLLACLFVLI